MGIVLTELEEKDYEKIYHLMEVAFEKEEIRTCESGREQLNKGNYRILISPNNKDDIGGFIAEWDLETFVFIEHFAVEKELRGLGIGSKMLEEYLKKATKPVMVEVEDNETEIGKRRINFYKRMGFFLSEFGYHQPILRGDGEKEILLRIMSFPEELSEEGFLEFKKVVFEKIYKRKN
ncbi:GNAT family N-acetyltransferase [Acetobacterium paludosum]|uniref:GNAT family N-acetyltransferase n=1 Tax=Acetobacterium paludosum TaxID=52693 RepID=A0A923HY09_9FIRM|nr:GNAT family N-acetyltransferase [Acetobacterium paludosum]MBC3889227.1 GNAT family N-acetyltransferase [Acetobacterium paludosum]